MRSLVWVLLLFTLSFAAAADDRAELQGLYATLGALNQEQQSLFQQFQMLQEVRRSNDRAFYSSQLQPADITTQVPNYEDVVQAQKEVLHRGEEMTRQSDQLYAQYNEIEAKKAQVRQRILELTRPK